MTIAFDLLKKSKVICPETFSDVSSLAHDFLNFLNDPQILNEISKVHQIGAWSTQVQKAVLPGIEKLGFSSEKKGLFNNYEVTALRPDYYAKVRNSGVLLEVERGKTIANNMDILDFWKCHICDFADYLFLLVPQVRQATNGKPTQPYKDVKRRLSTFFVEKNHVNVDAVFFFGY